MPFPPSQSYFHSFLLLQQSIHRNNLVETYECGCLKYTEAWLLSDLNMGEKVKIYEINNLLWNTEKE